MKPVTRALADIYETALAQVAPQVCSGDIIGGSQNLVLQSENFPTSWNLSGTPTNVAWGSIGGIALSTVGDDDVGGREGYEQNLVFTGNAVKAISLFVNQGSSTSSTFRLRDNTAAVNRLLAVLTWSGGLPVVAMTTGTNLGYDDIGSGVYRLKFATTSVTASNTNELGIYVATDAALAVLPTGNLAIGGVQAENATTPTSYIKTTTAAVQTLSVSCCSEILGPWVPVKTADGYRVTTEFALHEI